MGITDRIKKLGNYFKEMQIVTIDGKQVNICYCKISLWMGY